MTEHPGGAEGAPSFGVESPLEPTGFDFQGVALRVFPLRANYARLQAFLDRYLNITPLHYFRPASPFVLFNAINYGRMEPAATDIGWTTQDEFTFSIPLHWYQKEGDQWRFFADASVTPFLFVDDASSVVTGREVYGWPKVLARVVREVNPWMKDPRSPRRLLSLTTGQYSELYRGRELEERPLLEIAQRDSQTLLGFPPATERIWAPALLAPEMMVQSWWALVEQMMACMRPTTGDQPPRIDQVSRLLAPANPDRPTHTLNLKQFRASEPSLLCYQSLVGSTLRVRHFEAGGPLGNVELLRGDPSGGYELRIRRHTGFPIVETLGLSVDRQEVLDDVEVSTLRPYFPYWTKVDLSYSFGRRIAYRGESTPWYDDEGRAISAAPLHPNRYNTALGPLVDPPAGAFDFPDTTIRVLPLLARADAIRGLLEPLDEALREVASTGGGTTEAPLVEPFPVFLGSDGERGEAELCYVLMMATDRSRAESERDAVGWWSSRSVSFAVVVRLADSLVSTESGERDAASRRYFLFWPRVYADSPTAVIQGREVTGLDVMQASLESGRDPWIETLPDDEVRRLLEVWIKDFPAVGVDAEAIELQLLQVLQGAGGRDPGNDTAESRAPRAPESENGSGAKLLRDLVEHVLTSDELPIGLHLYNLALKQFPDEEDPFHRSCYQAIVVYETLVGRWQAAAEGQGIEIERLEGPLAVRFQLLEAEPIAESLGLVGDERRDRGGRALVARPAPWAFAVRVDERRLLPRDVFFRVLEGEWQDADLASALEESEHHPSCSARPKSLEAGSRAVSKKAEGRTDVGHIPLPEPIAAVAAEVEAREPDRILTLDRLVAIWRRLAS